MAKLTKQERRADVGYFEVEPGVWQVVLTSGQGVLCSSEEEAQGALHSDLEAQIAFRWMDEDLENCTQGVALA